MKLYTGPLSLFSAKVRIALAEKGLVPDPHVSVGWSPERRYLPHHPDVAALNPRRQVPVLVDGDAVVCDSTVILEYLEERHPEPALYPREPAARARCRRFEVFADDVLFPPLWDLIEEAFYPAAPGGARDGERLARARARLAVLYAELDAALDGREHLCGAYTVADLACFVMVSSAASLGAAPGPELHRLRDWMARVGARPAVRAEVDAMRARVAALLAPAAAVATDAAAPAPA